MLDLLDSTFDIGGLPLAFAPRVRKSRDTSPLPSIAPTRRRSPRRRVVDIARVSLAVKLLDPLPTDGEEIIGSLSGDAAVFDLISAVATLIEPASIAALTIASLGFSRDNTAATASLIDAGRIQRCEFILSHYFRSADQSTFAELKAMLEARNQVIHVARVHAKIALLTVSDGRRFVIEGSANYRSCKNIEQHIVSACPVLFDHRRKLLDAAIQTATQ